MLERHFVDSLYQIEEKESKQIAFNWFDLLGTQECLCGGFSGGPFIDLACVQLSNKGSRPKAKINSKTFRFLDAVVGFKENCQGVKKSCGGCQKVS